MRLVLRALGAGTTAALGLALVISAALPSAAQQAVSKVTITVVGIDRSGTQVAIQSSVVPLRGNAIPSSGPTYQVTPGTYFIGASVPTVAGGNPASDTIVIRRVNVTASQTFTLDARGGKLVSVWLDGKNLGSPGEAGGCIRGGYGVIYPSSGAPQLYVKPVSVANVGFEWTVSVPGPRTSTRDLAGGSKAGLPANPVYRLSSSQLVPTVIQAKAGPVPDTAATWATSVTASDGCALPGGRGSVVLPARVTDYRTPGSWHTEVDTDRGPYTYVCSRTWANQKYLAGHRYAVTFGNAAHGPSRAVPVVAGTVLSFDPSPGFQFSDPQQQGYEYCNTVIVTLSRAGQVVKSRSYTGYAGPVTDFAASVRTGWYVLSVNAKQSESHQPMPGSLLSPRTSLRWRFRIGQGAIPVAVMSFLALGLNMANMAAPGSVTTIKAWATQNQYTFPPGARSAATKFSVQVSFDTGKTWHAAKVVRHRGYWTIPVRNPRSGYVSIRSTTVNTAGDSSVQTIYRAYRIG
jgi:hypothetical protein